MKKISQLLKILSIASATSIAVTTGTLANETTTATTGINLNNHNSIRLIVPPPQKTDDRFCSNTLGSAISSVVDSPSYKNGKWGILVQSLDGRTIYSLHPDSYMIPASNLKLLTTAAALQSLSPFSYINSKSLKEWIAVTNLKSNNFYADTLLRRLGGAIPVGKALATLGVDSHSYRMADGSGLSRKNLATPRVFVKTLRAMKFSTGKEIFMASLPIAGVNGTLINRMRYSQVAGAVRAKTGTLKGVRALSGYMEHPEYGTIVFSIIVNHPGQSGSALVKAIDDIVLKLFKSSPYHC